MSTKRNEALQLSEELLTDIELMKLSPVGIVRKASRLARLLDDSSTLNWLSFEVSGYPSTSIGGISTEAWDAAGRSGRRYFQTKDGRSTEKANVQSLSFLHSKIESSQIRLKGADSSNFFEKNNMQTDMMTAQDTIDKVMGAVYQYTAQVYQELRFGAAVETAFESLRNRVDGAIANLVPNAMPMLTTALENAQSDNPEQWKNAAKACRDLIKACADELRPPGEDKDGRKMGDAQYVNRLVDWIQAHSKSKTKADLIKADLDHLGRRLDANADGGNKGAHASVSKDDASRYIVGTYLFLGDILELSGD